MKYIISSFLGIFVGIITLFGQKYLPDCFRNLANSGAVWLVPAFLLSYYLAVNIKSSIIICTVTLIFSVFGYYIFEAIYNSHSIYSIFINVFIYIWLICAIVGGAIFGYGAYCAKFKSNYLRYFGMNLLPSVFISEGFIQLIHIKEYIHMIPNIILIIVLGIVIYFVINRRESFLFKNFISLLLITFLGIIGYSILYHIS